MSTETQPTTPKPCPFCGSENIGTFHFGTMRAMECVECGALGPHLPGKELAMEAWNARKEP